MDKVVADTLYSIVAEVAADIDKSTNTNPILYC